MIILIIVFSTLICLAYFVIAYFFPEWVGIAGKTAREDEEHHRIEDPNQKMTPNENDCDSP